MSNARLGQGQGRVKERSRQGQGKANARSKQCQSKFEARSRQGQDKIKTRSGQVHGKVKERSKRGQGKLEIQGQEKINVRLKQSNCNSNHNYNLMGFDTIEISLVLPIFFAHIFFNLNVSVATPKILFTIKKNLRTLKDI